MQYFSFYIIYRCASRMCCSCMYLRSIFSASVPISLQ